MRREVYEAVGGLDEKYLIGDFEDSDLCFRAREAGFHVFRLRQPLAPGASTELAFRLTYANPGAPESCSESMRFPWPTLCQKVEALCEAAEPSSSVKTVDRNRRNHSGSTRAPSVSNLGGNCSCAS